MIDNFQPIQHAGLESYNPLSIEPQILSILVVLIILVACAIYYNKKIKVLAPNDSLHGFALFIQIYVQWIRGLVVEIFGEKHEKFTPYFVYLFAYIFLSNIISVFGIENPTSSLTVTLSMGLVTWFGTHILAFRYQKLSYLLHFCFKMKIKGHVVPLMINPIELIGAISPLISISFRLWGNIFAGSVIVTLWFYFTGFVYSQVPYLGMVNLFAGFTAPAIHLYFDLLCGMIQALVFTLLTMVYWRLQMNTNH